MDRVELEGLDRDELIARAERAGTKRARILTRPELVDELLLRAARSSGDEKALRRARGFFGVARDLLARVVERGLHLPDAAQAIRAVGIEPPPPPRVTPAALPTVTLAEIYATQGHRERAVETLSRVLEREPDHAAARALLTQLEDAAYVAPPPPLPPEDDAPPPTHEPEEPVERGVDECIALPTEPTSFFLYWQVTDETLAALEAARQGGVIALRVLVIEPGWDGPRPTVRDHDVAAKVGEFFLRELPARAVLRAAIGWRTKGGEGGGDFTPIAHSPALEAAPGSSGRAPGTDVAHVLAHWTPDGHRPVTDDDPSSPSIVRALARARLKPDRTAAAGAREGW